MAKPILLYDYIHSALAESFTEKVFEHPKDESIEIWVNGPGGSLSAGWSMLAALHDRDVNITVTGDASSFYFFMLLFSDNNTAFDTSNFLVHRAASFWEEIMTEEELKEVENRNKIIRKKLEARIDENKFIEVTGKTFDDIFDMENRLDVRLTAQQAKKIGLVDKVIKLNVKKRAEIESRYFHDIAALANPIQSNNNSKSNKMGKLTDLIFGEKDPVLIAQIEETQFVYSKLEKGTKIKATGKEDVKPISGTFEADNKQVTVVENEITAIVEIDNSKKEIDSLKVKIEAFEKNQITVNDIKEVFDEYQKKHDSEMKDLKDILAKAKITTSKPNLPKGEFKDEPVTDDLTLREKLAIEQNKAHEAKLKKRGE